MKKVSPKKTEKIGVFKNKKGTCCRVFRKKHLFAVLLFFLVAVPFIGWIGWSNSAPETTDYTVYSADLPAGFDGYRIAHISDLHDAELGKDHEKLLTLLRNAAPDIIVITGDLVDRNRTDLPRALSFAEKAMAIAPCYYVTGNHEGKIPQYPQLKAGLTALGVKVLENERVDLTRGGDRLALLGLRDPLFAGEEELQQDLAAEEWMAALKPQEDVYTVLLAHRPTYFEIYQANSVDLVFCGHNHGGQFRLPFVGGLYTPREGFFPVYDGGLYEEGGTVMVVSRGIGNSTFPFRFNNRPEVVVVQLASK